MRVKILAVGVVAAVAAVAITAFSLGGSRGPDRVSALPASAEAQFGSIALRTADGRDVAFADKKVTCELVFTRTADEGVYSCPAPYDLTPYLESEPMTAAVGPGAATSLGPVGDAITFVKSYAIVSGLPGNSWQTLQVYYGATLNSPVVTIGEQLAWGEGGHIENPSNQNTTRGVYSSYFYFRGHTNGSGYLGTEFLAVGN